MQNVHEESENVAMSIDEATDAILGQWSDGANLSDDQTETATASTDDETVGEVEQDEIGTEEEEALIAADSDEENTEHSDQDEDTDEAEDEAIEAVAADDDDIARRWPGVVAISRSRRRSTA